MKIDMMENSPWKRFDDYNLHKGVWQFIPENKSYLPQYSMADDPPRYSAFMQKPIDLQLPADEFISHYVNDNTDNIELTLGLSIGQPKAKDNKSCERNKSKSYLFSSDVIDLEDPNFGILKNNTGCSNKDEHKFGRFLQIGMNHIPYGSSPRESVLCLGPISGCIGNHREFPSADLFSKNQTSGACKPKNLDLNMVQFEYTSCLSNNFSTVQNPSTASFSGAVEKKVHRKDVFDLCEYSDNKHRQLDLNIELTNSCEENNEGGICVIDVDSDSGEPCSSNKSNPKLESIDSSSNLLNNIACKIDFVDAETQVAAYDQSNNLKTKQSVAICEDLNVCGFDNTESNIQYINIRKLEADETAQKAAESLVKISLESHVCHNRPQRSSDSYERMVLWAKESDADDFCTSSSAFVVDESENKAVISRYKLKRGTRMKDFQKDVLPSLSILSRNEINEDINIIEGIIRSREYKKMRAKAGDEGERRLKVGRGKRCRAGYNRRYH